MSQVTLRVLTLVSLRTKTNNKSLRILEALKEDLTFFPFSLKAF